MQTVKMICPGTEITAYDFVFNRLYPLGHQDGKKSPSVDPLEGFCRLT